MVATTRAAHMENMENTDTIRQICLAQNFWTNEAIEISFIPLESAYFIS